MLVGLELKVLETVEEVDPPIGTLLLGLQKTAKGLFSHFICFLKMLFHDIWTLTSFKLPNMSQPVPVTNNPGTTHHSDDYRAATRLSNPQISYQHPFKDFGCQSQSCLFLFLHEYVGFWFCRPHLFGREVDVQELSWPADQSSSACHIPDSPAV